MEAGRVVVGGEELLDARVEEDLLELLDLRVIEVLRADDELAGELLGAAIGVLSKKMFQA